MNRWKHFIETIDAIKEVGAAMINQLRSPSPRPTKLQGLEVTLMDTPDDYCTDSSFSTLELTPSGYENWERFPAVAEEFARRLLSNLYVLTAVRVFPSGSSKKSAFYPFRSQEEVFLHTYAEILRLQGFDDCVHYQSPSDIITATHGANVPLSTMLFSGDYGIGFDYHAYGFATQPPSADILQAKKSIETVPHILHLTCERYPDTLDIHINTGSLSVLQCLTTIRDVCAERSISLEIDPALESQIC